MIQLYRDEAGEFRFRIKGANGEIVASSEGYTRKHDAKRGVVALWRRMQTDQDMVAALDIAAGWFDEYAGHHDAKGTQESTEKANINRRRAAYLRQRIRGPEIEDLTQDGNTPHHEA